MDFLLSEKLNRNTQWSREQQHRGSIRASHLDALGSIVGIPEDIFFVAAKI